VQSSQQSSLTIIVNDDGFKEAISVLDKVKLDKDTNQDWLFSETEKFCQDRDFIPSQRKLSGDIDSQYSSYT
jgi:hypothetical protein